MCLEDCSSPSDVDAKGADNSGEGILRCGVSATEFKSEPWAATLMSDKKIKLTQEMQQNPKSARQTLMQRMVRWRFGGAE